LRRIGLIAAMLALHGLAEAGETPGTVVYKYCVGAILKLTPVADRDGHFQIALRSGDGWALYGKGIFDDQRRLVAQEVEGQGTVRFDPHNCEKVAGFCEYSETGLDGTTMKKVRLNGRIGDQWDYTIFDDFGDRKDVIRVGKVSYAEDGLALRDEWTDVNSTGEGCFERIEAPDAPAVTPDASGQSDPVN
jgi:hypothetical protein